MKAWNIGARDKLTPFSSFGESIYDVNNLGEEIFKKECALRCRDTPGCFKFKLDGPETCVLRGHEIENPNQNSFG